MVIPLYEDLPAFTNEVRPEFCSGKKVLHPNEEMQPPLG